MAAPTVVAVGTITTWNVTSSPATVDISWPTHQADDIGICVVVGKNYDFTPPAGWTKITFSGFGTSESTTALSIGLYWKRATSGSEAAFTVPTTYYQISFTISIEVTCSKSTAKEIATCFTSNNHISCGSGSGDTTIIVKNIGTTGRRRVVFCSYYQISFTIGV
jgi:hypothetical protein